MTTPDLWSLYRIEYNVGTDKAETQYRVLASWGGSYLYGASWKLSSDIVSAEAIGRGYQFKMYSGRVYDCTECGHGMTAYAAGEIERISTSEPAHKLTLISETKVKATLQAAGLLTKGNK